MTRQKLIEILKQDYQSIHTVQAIACGRRKPNPDLRYQYEKKYGIPFSAWLDIRAYLNDTPTTPATSRAPGAENAQKETA